MIKVQKNINLPVLEDVKQLTGFDIFNQLATESKNYNDINKHISEIQYAHQQEIKAINLSHAETLFNKDKIYENTTNQLKFTNNSLKQHLINEFDNYLVSYDQGNAAMSMLNAHKNETSYLQHKNNQLINDNDILMKRVDNKFDEHVNLYERGQEQLKLLNNHQIEVNKLMKQNAKLPSKSTVSKLNEKIRELEDQLDTANQQSNLILDNNVELISKLETRISNLELIRQTLQQMLDKSDKERIKINEELINERQQINPDKEKELLQQLIDLKVQNQAYINKERETSLKHELFVKRLHENIQNFEAAQKDLTSKLHQSNKEKIEINTELATNKQQLKSNTDAVKALTKKYEQQNKTLLDVSIQEQLVRDENETLKSKLKESITEMKNFKELTNVIRTKYNKESKYSSDLKDKLESTTVLMNTLLNRKSNNAITPQDTILYIKSLQDIVKEQQLKIKQYEGLSGTSKNQSDFQEIYSKRALPISELYTDNRVIALENSRIKLNNEVLELHQKITAQEKQAVKWIKEDYTKRDNYKNIIQTNELAISNLQKELDQKNERLATLDLAIKWPAVAKEFLTLIKNTRLDESILSHNNEVSPQLYHLQSLLYKEYINNRFTKDELDVIAVQLITMDPIQVLNDIKNTEYLTPFVQKTAEIKGLYKDRYTELIKLGETAIRVIPPILAAAFRAHYELNENILPRILMMLK